MFGITDLKQLIITILIAALAFLLGIPVGSVIMPSGPQGYSESARFTLNSNTNSENEESLATNNSGDDGDEGNSESGSQNTFNLTNKSKKNLHDNAGNDSNAGGEVGDEGSGGSGSDPNNEPETDDDNSSSLIALELNATVGNKELSASAYVSSTGSVELDL